MDYGVGDVDGRCWFWVWVHARVVFSLVLALLAGPPAGPGGVYHLLVLWVLRGFSPFLAEVLSLVGVLQVLLQELSWGEV